MCTKTARTGPVRFDPRLEGAILAHMVSELQILIQKRRLLHVVRNHQEGQCLRARKNQMTEEYEDIASLFGKLVKRSYITYQSRIKASERLARLNAIWNLALMVSAVSVTITSVVLLVDDGALGIKGTVVLTCASIITLFISVAVSGMNLSGKSRDMFTSYRRIQRLSAQAEREAVEDPCSRALASLASDYDDLLDNSDNHALCDYLKVRPSERNKWWIGRADWLALLAPVGIILASVGLSVPAILWFLL